MGTARHAPVRIVRAWHSSAPEQRVAAVTAGVLLLSMFLPWYEKNVVVGRGNDTRFASDSISAFGALSFVEAAIFLVAGGVLALIFLRAERRAFHLPGGDGTIVFGAGLWAAFLLFVRVFSKPSVPGSGSTVGIQWGFFIAFLAAGGLAYAGWRMRVADRAEPTAAQDPTARVEPAAALDRPLDPPPSVPRRPATRRRATPEDRTRIAGQLSFGDEDDLPSPPTWDEPRRRG